MNAIDSLSEDDKKLPQLDAILPLLKRGVGIHHGGLLPILKEVIEILFQVCVGVRGRKGDHDSASQRRGV